MAIIESETVGIVSWAVAAIAAINWGVEGALDKNLLTSADFLGLSASNAELAYIVIGVFGIINGYLLVEELM
jgi:uncharacterized membrane protein YuzA (DUF378 family)